jgi:DNA-binding CsgD family transcriptional regulator
MAAEYGEPLTERQLEIVALVAQGLTNREIAAELYISHNTVKVHLRNVFTKTGVSSRTELSMLAMREGWVALSDTEEKLAPVEVEVSEAEERETAEAPTATDAQPETSAQVLALPAWAWHRWAALGLGLLLALVVLWLPPRRSSAVNGRTSAGALVDQPAAAGTDPTVNNQEDAWEELAPLPERRARFGATVLDGDLYVVGGLTDAGPTGRLDVYDRAEDRWRTAPPRPAALANVGAVAVADGILVPGGCDVEGHPQAVVHHYDVATGTWSEVAPLPIPLCAYAITTLDGNVYLFGGWDGTSYQAAAYRYTTEVDTWEALASPAEARGFGAAAPLGGQLFYVGGYDGETERSTCETYVLEEARWTRCASLLQPRGGLGLAAIGGQLFAVGGGWESYLGFSERFIPAQDTWMVAGSPLTGEWRNLGVVAQDTTLYALGGWSGEYLNRTYALEVLPFRVFIPVTLP